VTAPDHIRSAVARLSLAAGLEFQVTDEMVSGTEMYVVYAEDHPLPDRYNQAVGTLGFRVPRNLPDGQPEDSFFVITQMPLKLATADPTRNSTDVHRASVTTEFFKGTSLDGRPALVFSWHLWDRFPWNRGKHTLVDHYTHCVRRFDQPEHD
jgi:hypothetical protein